MSCEEPRVHTAMARKIMNSFSGIFDMLKENEQYSLTRVLPTLGYLTFIAISVYLAYNGKTWGHYTEFTAATGGSVLIQLGNKFINSRYNTPLGSAGKNIREEKKND